MSGNVTARAKRSRIESVRAGRDGLFFSSGMKSGNLKFSYFKANFTSSECRYFSKGARILGASEYQQSVLVMWWPGMPKMPY